MIGAFPLLQQSGSNNPQRPVRIASGQRVHNTKEVAGKAVANFFTPLSKKEPEHMSWRIVSDSLLIGRHSVTAATQAAKAVTTRRKIAAFDFVRWRTGALSQPA